MKWLIYVLRCSDNSLYTGITNNIEKRMLLHNKGKGSKYVFSRKPFVKVYEEIAISKSDALKLEYKIKKMTKKEKENFIISHKLV